MSEVKGLLRKYSRLILFVAVFSMVVFLLARHISAFGNILLVVLGFGAVVLVHEFGHFILAKLSDIKVEAFSIGFPPVLAGILKTEKGFRVRILPGLLPAGESEDSDGSLLKFMFGRHGRAGETEYQLGLIPFGGFVKMLGQEDTKEVEKSDDPRSYANKPVGARIGVIASGVVFNVISAVLVFMIVFLVGIKLTPPIIGGVLPDSPAEVAGLKAGDEVIEISGRTRDLDFGNIMMAAALSGRDKKVAIKVRREDESIENFELAAEQMPGMQIRLFGVSSPSSLIIAKVKGDDANDLFSKTGLKAGDRIRSVNGIDVDFHWQMKEIVEKVFLPAVTVLAERVDVLSKETGFVESQIPLELLHAVGEVNDEPELCHIYSMVPRLRVTAVFEKPLSTTDKMLALPNTLLIKLGIRKETAREKIKLKEGDIIVSAGDIENPTYQEIREATQRYANKELPVKVLRHEASGVEQVLSVTVKPWQSEESGRAFIGITLALDAGRAVVAKTITAKDGPARLEIPRGAQITAVDGVNVSSFYDILRELAKHKGGERISIEYRLTDRQGGVVSVKAVDEAKVVTVKSIFAKSIPFDDIQRLYKASGPAEAIGMGARRAIMFIANAYLTLKRFAGGLVSAKSFMGPVGIAKLSYDIVTERPFIYYVYFIGLINAFIAVFNFLPFLPLDGGHIVFLTVEKVKGSPVSERIQGIVTYIGLVAVGAFALYVTFNDIVRSFFS
ncbi:MAG: site-2 protease family protein [Planctomycetota bacterium]|jgi:regulator of sigma E protease